MLTELLQEIITLLTSGITQFATGIGSGLQSLVTSIFVKTGENGGLSDFGGLIVIFGAISLTIGLSYFVVNWLTSWGN